MQPELWDRLRSAVAELVRELVPTKYLGFYEYQVVSYDTTAQAANVAPLSDPEMPTIEKLPIRTPGMELDLPAGTSVLVGFRNGDLTKPFILPFDLASGGAFPTRSHVNATELVELGSNPVLNNMRQGDMVTCPTLGVSVMFCVLAVGDNPPIPTPMMTNTPYYLSFSSVPGVPPVFPATAAGLGPGALYGYGSSGTVLVKS